MQEAFFRRLWYGSAPLVVWALHFFGSYAVVAAGCGTAAPPFLRTGLLVASVLALALIGWMLMRHRRRQGHHRLLDAARLGSGALAAVGIAWTTLPLVFLPVCGSR